MDAVNTSSPTDASRPRTVTVLGFLVAAAAALSYLGSYALTNALLAQDILKPWAPGSDPRPRWLALGFVTLLGVFGLTGVAARVSSSRQLRSIDALADETEEFRINDA